MQYQVFNKDSGEVIAWIDTDSEDVVLHKDYDIKSGNTLSAVEVEEDNTTMTVKQYQNEAKRFNIPNSSELLDKCFERPFKDSSSVSGVQYVKHGDLVYSLLGIAGESGEVIDLIKKFIFQSKSVDIVHLKKEIGDLTWYIVLLCNTLGIDLQEVFQMNIDKLSARYPHGFNSYDANHRADEDI